MSNIDDVAESISREERTRKAISILMTNKNESTRKYILSIYTDPALHSIYNGLRAEASINSKMSDDRKLSIKFPDQTVFKFCRDLMTVKYGEDWLQNKNIFYEDLIIPWVIRRP